MLNLPKNLIFKDIEIFDPLSQHDWDEQVSGFPYSTFFHSSAWLRVLRNSYGFKPIAFAYPDRNNPTAIFTIMEVDSWLTGRRGVSLPFSDFCPPLHSSSKDSIYLYARIVEYAASRAWKYLEIRESFGELNQNQHSTCYLSHTLDLTTSPKNLFQNLSSANRRAIRKANKSSIQVEKKTGLEDVRVFFELLCLTRKRHGLPPQPWSFFVNLFEEVISKDLGCVFLANRGSRPIAGAIFVNYNQKVIFKFGASDKKFQELRANNLVIWTAIQRFVDDGWKELHFGRSAPENEGLMRFKRQWNAVETSVSYDRLNISTLQIEQIKEGTKGWFNRFFEFLPIPLSKTAGNVLYKHVA